MAEKAALITIPNLLILLYRMKAKLNNQELKTSAWNEGANTKLN
jgi:hypothetical protein